MGLPLQVYSSCCKNCLLSDDRIVSLERAKQIIEDCKKDQNYFICHKASMENKEIVCKKFYDELGQHSQMIRIAERLNMVEFVEQPDSKRLPSHKDMEKK